MERDRYIPFNNSGELHEAEEVKRIYAIMDRELSHCLA